MKILIVTDAWEPQVNGVVRTLKSTARELTRMGHEVEFLTPRPHRVAEQLADVRLVSLPGHCDHGSAA